MTEPGDYDDTGSEKFSLRGTLWRWGSVAVEQWHTIGRPLAERARDTVVGVAADPRAELERERTIKISEAHLQRLLAEQVAKSRHVSAGELHLEDGAVRISAVIPRWRPVHARARFALEVGRQDEDIIELGVRRLEPTVLDSPHWLMGVLVRAFMAWRHFRHKPDLFDFLLLRVKGSRRAGDRVYVPLPRAPITALAGKSRVLRQLVAYAAFSSVTARPGRLVIGYHWGRLAERMADMRVLKHLMSAPAEDEVNGNDDEGEGDGPADRHRQNS